MRHGTTLRKVPLTLMLLLSAVSGGCKQGPWTLWNSYAAKFIDSQGRVIDPQGGDRTTSEGQSYALFFALADNDRPRFDQVLAWTRTNLAGGNLGTRLPGWLWGKAPDGQWKLLDPNPASDSDCWIAYSLLEAGRLWHNPAYTALGHQVMALIAKQEVAELPGFGSMLMPGNTALWVHNQTWTVNPSYLPLFLFDRFQQEDPAGPWGAIAMNVPNLLRQSVRHGFVMDWADYVPSDGFYPAAPPLQPGKPQPQAAGSYDAIRVYLWAGMLDGGGHRRTDLVGAISGMASYVANHGAPPEKVNADGIPLEHDGPIGFSAALLPYLKALPDMGKTSAQQRVRMSEQLDPSTGLYGKDPAYYDQNLVLFATGYLNSRFRFGTHGELSVEWTRE
ncbi:cellulase [Acidobacteria bacterium AB60]|nr:cellulase [Acidobacteria bacterium AB60]